MITTDRSDLDPSNQSVNDPINFTYNYLHPFLS